MAVLGDELRQLRLMKGKTLREVEKLTDVSNAYLSQLETGKTNKPSPHILHKLAELYGASYTRLMELAGYLQTSTESDGARRDDKVSSIGAALMTSDLTADEEKQVKRFIEFLRQQRSAQ